MLFLLEGEVQSCMREYPVSNHFSPTSRKSTISIPMQGRTILFTTVILLLIEAFFAFPICCLTGHCTANVFQYNGPTETHRSIIC